MASRRKRKKSSRKRITSMPSMKKSSSVPSSSHGKDSVEWPGAIEDKYVEDIKNRLNVIEQNSVSDEMIKAFLAANDMRQRDAVEALKSTVEWRKGRQMFWNNYRLQNERYQFLQHIRRSSSSVYGHTKSGRLVFYEKIGENFSLPLHKEFSVSEYTDHVIVWCEHLLSAAFANAGKSMHLIHEIPYYSTSTSTSTGSESKEEIPINEYQIVKQLSYNESKCKYSDVVGIIDWAGLRDESAFLANKEILLACAELLSTYYPHLINRLYHINMPLHINFEKILKWGFPAQVLHKSIFLESSSTKQKRLSYLKKQLQSRSRYKAKPKAKEIQNVIDDNYANEQLLTILSSGQMSHFKDNFTNEKFDSIYRSLVGMSSMAQDESLLPKHYSEMVKLELQSWKHRALRSAERYTERIPVQRGQHYTWQYQTDSPGRELFFGVEYSTEGFRGKSIRVIVRNEQKQKCAYCPIFGDFIVLKDGHLTFQFRNLKGARRLNLQYKIENHTFPLRFINKHLPDYHAEERLLQTNTLTIGGKAGTSKRNINRKYKRSPSEYSGSTAISTSPPPNSTKSVSEEYNESKYYKEKIKRAKSQRNKKSTKTKKKSKKLSKAKRAKTPEPNTPI